MNTGIDLGFHSTKVVGPNGAHLFPSFAVGAVDSLLSLNGHDRIVIETARGKMLVGSEAVKLAKAGARKETADWIMSDEYLALFHAGLSETTTATGAAVTLVTGLPVADYARDRDTLRDRLQGTHTFTRQGRRGQTFRIENVRVIPQAWGAVLDLLLNDSGKIVRPELAKEKVAVIDIGGHTVNYLSVDGLSDIPNETEGTERGAWNVVRAVRDYLNTAHPGLARLRDHQIMDAVIDGELYDAGEPVDLGPVVQPIINEIGQEIIDTAGQHWGPGAATFRQVIVCGGGANLWGGHIGQAFRHAVVLEDPVYANARGFYKFAGYLEDRS